MRFTSDMIYLEIRIIVIEITVITYAAFSRIPLPAFYFLELVQISDQIL